jgi:hypothetical protein
MKESRLMWQQGRRITDQHCGGKWELVGQVGEIVHIKMRMLLHSVGV